MSPRSKDYLVRQAEGVGAMLARILGLRTGGNTEEAAAALQDAYGQLLGPRSEILRSVDSHTAASLLGSARAVLALARLTNEEAEQELDAERSAALRLRAVQLGLEAAERDDEDPEIRSFLDGLAPRVDQGRLTDAQRAALKRGTGA